MDHLKIATENINKWPKWKKELAGLPIGVIMLPETYCNKEFLTDAPEPGTSTVVSFHGNVIWHTGSGPEQLSFLEISSCHERARLHRTYDMTEQQWIEQVRRLRDHINKYLDFLEA